jgi:hypothetical protein
MTMHRYTYRRKLDGELAQIQRLKELQLRVVALVGTVTLCRDCDAHVHGSSGGRFRCCCCCCLVWIDRDS